MTLATSNPLVQPWNTPHGLPPFADVRAEHFKPAFDLALAQHLADVETIAADTQPPSFDNTVAAFDRSGRLLARIEALFYNLASSETSPAVSVANSFAMPASRSHLSPRFFFSAADSINSREASIRVAMSASFSWIA